MAETSEGTRRFGAGAVVGAVLAVLLVVFVFQNTEEQEVQVYFWEFSGPLWIVLLVTIAVGLVVLELVSTLWRRRRR